MAGVSIGHCVMACIYGMAGQMGLCTYGGVWAPAGLSEDVMMDTLGDGH